MLKATGLKGKIDFGIVSIREDEFAAVLQRFPKVAEIDGQRRYVLATCETINRNVYQLALVRAIAQGNLTSEDLTRDLIDDLDPNWLVVVGIAGGTPSDEFSLGDVVLATRLTDYTVGAVTSIDGHQHEFSVRGGPMNREIENFLATLKAKDDEISGWNEAKALRMRMPSIKVLPSSFYGSSEWKTRVKKSLLYSSELTRGDRPRYTTGPVVSTDNLIKDPTLLASWLTYNRDVVAVEMELAGIYVAARRWHRDYPILAIRGISDIVGLKRQSAWTKFACQSAASLAHALIRTQPIKPRVQNSNSVIRRNIKQEEVRLSFCEGAASVIYRGATLISPTSMGSESLTVELNKKGRYRTLITEAGIDPGSLTAKVYYAKTLSTPRNGSYRKVKIRVDSLPIIFQVHIMRDGCSYWESGVLTRILQTRTQAGQRLRDRIRHYAMTQKGLRGARLNELVDRCMELIEEGP